MKKLFIYIINILLIIFLIIKIFNLIDLFLVEKYQFQLEGFSDKKSIEDAKKMIPQLEAKKKIIQLHIIIIVISILFYNYIFLKLISCKKIKRY